MFNIDDIREIAIQIERNGEKAYRSASQAISDPLLAEIFTWMADEEKRHAEWFASIASDKVLTEEQRELEKMGRELLQEMVAGQTFSLDRDELLHVETFSQMLAQSKVFEQDTILFYKFLLPLIDDKQAQAQLEEIILEERRHFDQLGEMEESDNGMCRNLALA